MSRALKHDMPGHDWRVTADDVRAKGLEGIFAGEVAQPLPLVLEIGFGRGEFLLGLAEAARQRAFLGVEYSGKRVLKTARRLARTEEVVQVRHPSYGGQREFLQQVSELYGLPQSHGRDKKPF